MTKPLFTDDAYLSTCQARVTGLTNEGGIILDQTCFYATSGGQPGDTGFFAFADEDRLPIAGTVYGSSKEEIIHLPAAEGRMPEIGETVVLHVDWERRHRLMRMHTACHLLSVVCPLPITGAAVGVDESRVDFDMAQTVDKQEITARMMELVDANHRIYSDWISEADLAANPGLVKSKNVRPPKAAGRIRLVCIGEDAAVDSQPCGGTHVAETGQVGEIHIGKVEKKGRENRRFRIRFGSGG